MVNCLDLSNLRELTDGEKELEKELFEEFLSASEQCIGTLLTHLSSTNPKTWNETIHAFKGIAYNLGAMPLGALCEKAQLPEISAEIDKTSLLSAIQEEYKQVKSSLQHEMR